jgi:hypothetical protein
MGEFIKSALGFVKIPVNYRPMVFGLGLPALLAVLVTGVVLGVAAFEFLSDEVIVLGWATFKSIFAWEGPWMLFIGAVAQSVLASLRSRDKTMTAERQKYLDTLDVLGWGFVTIGALLCALVATFPWSPVV